MSPKLGQSVAPFLIAAWPKIHFRQLRDDRIEIRLTVAVPVRSSEPPPKREPDSDAGVVGGWPFRVCGTDRRSASVSAAAGARP